MNNLSLLKNNFRHMDNTKKIHIIIFFVSSFTMITICTYGAIMSVKEYRDNGKIIIGEILVNTEFPFKGLAKLVTYLMIASVVSWYCITKIIEDAANRIPKYIKVIFQIFTAILAIVSLYEVVYNFEIWNSLITTNAIKGELDLDRLNLPYPKPEIPWNMVFATKMFLAGFVISAHAFYMISKSIKTHRYESNTS